MTETRLWASPMLMRITGNPWGDYGYWCPACREIHEVAVAFKNPSNASWHFDGNMLFPTFMPSINIRIGPYRDGDVGVFRTDVCHHFLKAGFLEYQTDCTHGMAGQRMPLPPIPEVYSPHWPAYRRSAA